MSVVPLDPENTLDVNGVADLHVKHLGDSPIVQLGPRFLRKFFYTTLVRDGLIGCTLCRLDGRVVGFISYTRYPLEFMARGVRRHFFALSWLMLVSVLRRPSLIHDIYVALGFMRERQSDAQRGDAEDLGEVISIASEQDARKYVPPGGTSRLTVRLFEEMLAYFRRTGVRRIHLLVQPDNSASNLFCAAMGCEFEKVSAGGGVVHRYTYRVDELATEQKDTGP
jgi:hypothetical protein